MVKVAVIGAGFIGQLHRKAWEANGVSVKVMVDPFLSEEKKQAMRASGVEVTDDIDSAYALYPDIEAVSVCTPPGNHTDDFFKLLDYGSAVLMEKPVATRKEDYVMMLRKADEHHVKVMVGLTQRFYPEVQQAAKWIREGKIGRPVSFEDVMILSGDGLPSWYNDLNMSGGGVYITNGVHLLDRMQFILDSNLSKLLHIDIVKNPNGFDRIADVTGLLMNGLPFHIHLEWSQARELKRTVIFGTEGRIELKAWEHATLYDAFGHVIRHEPYSKKDTFEDRTLYGLKHEIQTFIKGIKGQFPKGLTLADHLPTMNVIWQGYGIEQEA